MGNWLVEAFPKKIKGRWIEDGKSPEFQFRTRGMPSRKWEKILLGRTSVMIDFGIKLFDERCLTKLWNSRASRSTTGFKKHSKSWSIIEARESALNSRRTISNDHQTGRSPGVWSRPITFLKTFELSENGAYRPVGSDHKKIWVERLMTICNSLRFAVLRFQKGANEQPKASTQFKIHLFLLFTFRQDLLID